MADIPWHDIFADTKNEQKKIIANSREKTSIFLYLMTCETDYGYNIASHFSEAYNQKIWKGTKSLNIKHPNKINSILKCMREDGLLLTFEEKKRLYPFYSYRAAPVDTKPARVYYCINPDVLLHPYKLELNSEEHDRIIHHVQKIDAPDQTSKANKSKSIIENLPDIASRHKIILRNPISDLELYRNFCEFFEETGHQEPSRMMPKLRWDYLQNLSTLRLIERYGIPPQKIIKYIDEVPELDYLTILVTAQFFADEILRIYQNVQLVQHFRNLKDGCIPISKQDRANLNKIISENCFFTNFSMLEKECSGMSKEYSAYPDLARGVHPEDALPFRTLMDSNIVLEVKRARSVQKN